MFTRLKIKNFKKFEDVDIDLGKSVVFIGPNNSGKSTALQALALWEIGLRKWTEKIKKSTSSSEKRPGVAVNRYDLISIPIPGAKLLWRDLHVRRGERTNGGQQTQNIRIDIIVEGVTNGKTWSCGLEFDYQNEESFYCKPLRLNEEKNPERMKIPDEALLSKIAFLPPMSGLAAVEPKWEEGRINVLLGEGQTAQVLRNLCYRIYEDTTSRKTWNGLKKDILNLFGVEILPPEYIIERGEITMIYKEKNGIELDISSSGRGLQQTLLLLSHLYANPGAILLLDEPDAHLEILRQRQIYQLINNVADQQGSQIIAASHSEVILNEAAGKDLVIAFVGNPHPIIDRGSHVLKSLREIGFDQYYQADLTGWILYLEGSTDLDILRAFANTLNHEARKNLDEVFLHQVTTNLPQKARDHFNGLKEARNDLVGVAIFDRIDKNLQSNGPLREVMWKKREIENYLCMEEVFISYAKSEIKDDLFGQGEKERRIAAMKDAINEVTKALKTLRNMDPWSPDTKVTDDFLDPLFELYFKALQLPNLMRKTNYHYLAKFVPVEKIDPEIKDKLDLIAITAKEAKAKNRI